MVAGSTSVATDSTVEAVVAAVHRDLVHDGSQPGLDVRRDVLERVRARGPLLAPHHTHEAVQRVLAAIAGLGPLAPLLDDPEVTEVMVNGPNEVWVERRGRLERVPLEFGREAIHHLIERVVGPLGLRADRSAPLVDARLPDGSRVNVVLPPLAIDGPCVTIRRFAARRIRLEAVAPPAVVELLRWAVDARWNLVVSGGTGSGKTTLLNALAAELPSGERVITVEDAAELQLPGAHVVRLESRVANAEGAGAATIRDLVRNALRMRPDRIVVGEVRGAEALDMVQAMNTGHDGSMSTCHANSPADALARLETMVLQAGVGLPLAAVRDQVAASIDAVVHVVRRPDGTRTVAAVAEVRPADAGRIDVRVLAGPRGVVEPPERMSRRPGAAPAPSPAPAPTPPSSPERASEPTGSHG